MEGREFGETSTVGRYTSSVGLRNFCRQSVFYMEWVYTDKNSTPTGAQAIVWNAFRNSEFFGGGISFY